MFRLRDFNTNSFKVRPLGAAKYNDQRSRLAYFLFAMIKITKKYTNVQELLNDLPTDRHAEVNVLRKDITSDFPT